MRVNLIAKKNGKLLAIDWPRIIITILVSCIILALVFHFIYLQNRLNVIKQEVSILNEQLNVYLPKQKEYLNLKNKLKELQKKPKINTTEYLWDQPLIELGYIIPHGAVLTGMEMNLNNISFNGKVRGSDKLLKIKERLKSSPVFKEVKITKIRKQQDIIFNIKAVIAEGGD